MSTTETRNESFVSELKEIPIVKSFWAQFTGAYEAAKSYSTLVNLTATGAAVKDGIRSTVSATANLAGTYVSDLSTELGTSVGNGVGRVLTVGERLVDYYLPVGDQAATDSDGSLRDADESEEDGSQEVGRASARVYRLTVRVLDGVKDRVTLRITPVLNDSRVSSVISSAKTVSDQVYEKTDALLDMILKNAENNQQQDPNTEGFSEQPEDALQLTTPAAKLARILEISTERLMKLPPVDFLLVSSEQVVKKFPNLGLLPDFEGIHEIKFTEHELPLLG